MLKKDYMVRQLEEFGKVLAAIVLLRRNKDWEKFNEELEKTVSVYTAMELKHLEQLSLVDFQLLLTQSSHLSNAQIKLLADLLFERYLANEEKADSKEYTHLLQKANHLFLHYQNNSTQNEYNLDVHYKLKTIQQLLHP
jgi:hypothetical protein